MQYVWQLRTKYYVASIGVHWITEPDPSNVAESSLFKVLQALILLVDSKNVKIACDVLFFISI